MIARVLLAALAAGLVAGLVATGLQAARITPLILKAEAYEAGPATSDVHDEDAAWAPAEGLERHGYTLMSNVLTGVGFALVLVAAFVLRGRPVDVRRGLLWGLAGFAVFTLAPALGLPPELPGSAAADLGDRQVWWIATVAATAAGLGAVVFARRWPARAAGAFAIALPHVVGAPHPETLGGPAPPELSAAFTVATLATAAAFWAVLGAVAGGVFARLERRAEA